MKKTKRPKDLKVPSYISPLAHLGYPGKMVYIEREIIFMEDIVPLIKWLIDVRIYQFEKFERGKNEKII
jgi:hypothetical protein